MSSPTVLSTCGTRSTMCGAHQPITRPGTKMAGQVVMNPALKPFNHIVNCGVRLRYCKSQRMSAEPESQSWSELEIEVPEDQRPINELEQLKTSFLYSWGTLDTPEYVKKLVIIWAGMFALVGGPIAFQTFSPVEQPLEFLLSGSTGALIVVAIANLRIYLGWKYVADRLMTATLAYEETGWYDGQFFVKPPEILTRDRLLGTYEARPVLNKLKTTLQGTGALLLVSALALSISISASSDTDGVYGRGASRITPDGILFSDKVTSVSDLMSDDEAAALEAMAQGGVPGYCRDRYFKSVSGGEEICDKLSQR